MSIAATVARFSFLEGMGVVAVLLGLDKTANEGRLGENLVKALTGAAAATVAAPASSTAPGPSVLYLPSPQSNPSIGLFPSALILGGASLWMARSQLLPVSRAALSEMSDRLKKAVISLQDTLLSKIGLLGDELGEVEATLQDLDEKLTRAEEAHERSEEREGFTVSGVLMLLRALMTLLPKDHRLAGDLKDLFARGREIDAKTSGGGAGRIVG
eukprot:CAMPEP_0182468692 /NCGR_PEP_ID=MMETSP1319-20130603/15896_1 /TAXON_ID=172717 /ORGANISM="Bolidomonas pacifica, Strain RCC208" /LENGTH=213 /DNA_ID=CAMNT_0024668917 /DNA_START=82 /DNA_END=720 /DNA_ORIENTATION=-